ncbi:MAG: hypothetical protein QOF83_1055 [Solirubrobacteraceae bacterium]|jgi:hypothetical protein|nr:hypothetical protein [Solirubrobacteraceae bacterium]
MAVKALPPATNAPGTERVRLARLAREVALTVPGVVDLDSGPGGLHVTLDGGCRIEGVRCVATDTGAYEVSLRLICGLVALPTLGRAVRSRVAARAARDGLGVDSVLVHVAGVVEAGR